MELADETVVNIAHDDDNEVSAVGELDNLQAEDGKLFADILIDTTSNAGAYADENLQTALESDGTKGFGGPSVEIPPEGQKIEFNKKKGVQELRQGKIDGLGLVMNPASKPVSFSHQTSQRAVAMSDGKQTTMVLQSESTGMAETSRAAILEEIATRELQMDSIQEHASMIADELDADVADVMEVLDPLMDDDMGGDMAEHGDGEEDDEEEQEMEEGEDDEEEEEEEDMDMMDDSAIDVLEEQIDDLWDAMDELKSQMKETQEMAGELADAETVQELSEAKEELEKRLETLEEEPEDPKSLADGESEPDPERNSTPVSTRDSYDNTIRR